MERDLFFYSSDFFSGENDSILGYVIVNIVDPKHVNIQRDNVWNYEILDVNKK